MEFVVVEFESGASEIYPMTQVYQITMNNKNEVEEFWLKGFDLEINAEVLLPYKEFKLNKNNKIKEIYITENIVKELAGVCKKC